VTLNALFMRGWRCRERGSWNVYAAILGEKKESNLAGHN